MRNINCRVLVVFKKYEYNTLQSFSRGVFAKVNIAKDAVVSDYRGLVLPFNEVDRMVRQLSTELQEYMDSYLVEFTHYCDNWPQSYLVLAHDPIYKKAVTNGRLFNHSHNHPNLVLEDRSKHSMQSSREVNIVLVLCATHKIKAGEQMLWCYGDEYAGNKLRQSCICNSCDPGLVAAVSLILAPLQPPPTLDMPWEEALSMSQHAPNMQLAPITTRAALISLALRSDVAGMVIAPEPFDDVDEAYRLGRQLVLGRQEQCRVAGHP